MEYENLIELIEEAGLFTNKFGSFSKSDYEVLMFTAYLDSLDKVHRDYDISIALGITESKVRNLRVKSQLLYPRKIEWQNELEEAINHGYYDSTKNDITLTLENPSVRNLIRNEIEKNYGTVGITLNQKQLVLPIEMFFHLALLLEKDKVEVIRKLNSDFTKKNKDIGKITQKNIKTRIFKGIGNIKEVITGTDAFFSSGKAIITALINLIGK